MRSTVVTGIPELGSYRRHRHSDPNNDFARRDYFSEVGAGTPARPIRVQSQHFRRSGAARSLRVMSDTHRGRAEHAAVLLSQENGERVVAGIMKPVFVVWNPQNMICLLAPCPRTTCDHFRLSSAPLLNFVRSYQSRRSLRSDREFPFPTGVLFDGVGMAVVSQR